MRRFLDNRVIHLAGKKGSRYNRPIFGNRFLPQSSEAYEFWNIHANRDFSGSFLRDQIADAAAIARTRAAVQKILAWQGRARFAAKITGPPRITFLNSIFPDARFIHVIRDGRAAVHSLLHVAFWRDKGGLSRPFWSDGLSVRDLQTWRNSAKDPGILAALQWCRTIEIARQESLKLECGRYMEIRYEDFVKSPPFWLRRMYEFSDLAPSKRTSKLLESDPVLVDTNKRYNADFDDDYVEKLTGVMESMLRELNYPTELELT